eukprot:82045-Rhodomonas_salina.8
MLCDNSGLRWPRRWFAAFRAPELLIAGQRHSKEVCRACRHVVHHRVASDVRVPHDPTQSLKVCHPSSDIVERLPQDAFPQRRFQRLDLASFPVSSSPRGFAQQRYQQLPVTCVKPQTPRNTKSDNTLFSTPTFRYSSRSLTISCGIRSELSIADSILPTALFPAKNPHLCSLLCFTFVAAQKNGPTWKVYDWDAGVESVGRGGA